jgi:3',5'-cyclic AMP phosphodiesterase CpdA
MDQPLDLMAFDAAPAEGRTWRVAHLSDVHIVGERYGFRVESGRSGPRGNDRLERVMARIEAIHSAQPLDLILISGDVTDAGRSSEWGEFLDMIVRHPKLAARMLILPGNHDVNIVDRANPARLDLPYSPARRLRQVRALSAMAAVQGDRVYVIDHDSRRLKGTLTDALRSYRQQVAAFADAGTLRLSAGLGRLWEELFPMLLPPDTVDGLGVLILNSNAETHFSFTNALGMISAEQVGRFEAAVGQFPQARWIVAVHHHVIEYPMPVAAFSVRVGTALINGSWFVRRLKSFAGRAVVMHGHRHIDWIGECGGVRIVSAPSPVMEAMDDEPTYFYIHTLAAGADGRLRLLSPERIDIAGVATGSACG